MMIKQLMTPVKSSFNPHDRLSVAVLYMQQNSFSCVLIVEGSVLKGILTERDVVRIFSEMIKNNALEDPLLETVMAKEVTYINPNTSLSDGLDLAWFNKLRHLPVVDDDGCLVGLVTQTDMIRCYSSVFEKQVELEMANKKLQLLSNEDALLGIGNRRAMEAGLAFADALAKRTRQPYCVALLDVDYFKKYNDHYGHQTGDDALQEITSAMKTSLRNSDNLYRYGGEEFLLLMNNTDIDEAIIGADRMRLEVENLQESHSESPYHYLTVSAGVSQCQQGSDWEQTVKRADQALYKAKESGRNRVCVSK